MALDVVQRQGDLHVESLLVTVNAESDRVAMHAVRRTLLEAQAERLGLPLRVVEIPFPCPNDVYEARMAEAVAEAVGLEIEHVVFGDLFLEDVRAYRETTLAGSGLDPVFPLWGRSTDALARDMLASGIRAVVTCVDPKQAPAELAGRHYDERFLADLPDGSDPCGERGEFHTFVWDAPCFSAPVEIDIGGVTERDGFVFCDVLPA